MSLSSLVQFRGVAYSVHLFFFVCRGYVGFGVDVCGSVLSFLWVVTLCVGVTWLGMIYIFRKGGHMWFEGLWSGVS